MKKIPISEANQKFVQMIKEVNKEGIIEIIKRGKGEYVIMTKEVYDQKIGGRELEENLHDGIWMGTERDGKLNKVIYGKIEDDALHIHYIILENEQVVAYGEALSPMSDVEIAGSSITMKPGKETAEMQRVAWTIKEDEEDYRIMKKIMEEAPEDLKIITLVLPHEAK